LATADYALSDLLSCRKTLTPPTSWVSLVCRARQTSVSLRLSLTDLARWRRSSSCTTARYAGSAAATSRHHLTHLQTGRSRGFGFVTFEIVSAAEEARKETNGTEIDGRRVRVDYSVTKRPHTPTPGQYMGESSRSEPRRVLANQALPRQPYRALADPCRLLQA